MTVFGRHGIGEEIEGLRVRDLGNSSIYIATTKVEGGEKCEVLKGESW